MLYLLEALKKIIERYIVNVTPVKTTFAAGSMSIPVYSSRRYRPGDEFIIYNQTTYDQTGEGELRTVACTPNGTTIEICNDPLLDGYTANNSYVQKLIGGNFVKAIYIGDPAKMSSYPAISINATTKDNEWLTLESITETYNVDITIFTEASHYEESYRLMHIYATAIENSLFRSLFPLVEPYHVGYLKENVEATDTVIQLTNAQDVIGIGGYIWLESWDYSRHNRVKEVLDIDNGVFELVFPVGKPFFAGDKVIRPGRHFYDSFPKGIQFGTINAETAVLKAAKLQFMAKEERRLGVKFTDPLDH